MTPEKIKQGLAEKGVSLSALAEVLNVSPASVGQVINRKLTSTRIARSISKIIGRDFYDVFPEYANVSPRVSKKIAHSPQKITEIREILT